MTTSVERTAAPHLRLTLVGASPGSCAALAVVVDVLVEAGNPPAHRHAGPTGEAGAAPGLEFLPHSVSVDYSVSIEWCRSA